MSCVQTPSCQGARAGVCPGEDTPKGRHVVTRVFREHTSLPLGLFALCFLGSSLLIPGPAWPQAGHALAYQVLSASSPLSPPGSSGPLRGPLRPAEPQPALLPPAPRTGSHHLPWQTLPCPPPPPQSSPIFLQWAALLALRPALFSHLAVA